MPVELNVVPRRAAVALAGAIALLLIAHLGGVVSRHGFGREYLYGFVPLFDLNEERNLPTWFSSTLLLMNAACLGLIAAAARRGADPLARGWRGLAILFLFLAVDEAASIHELLMYPLMGVSEKGGIFYFAWVLVYLAITLVVALLYWRFLFALPRRTAALLVAAGALYVGGAAGMELVGGAQADQHGRDSLGFVLLSTVEEVLEMGGATLLLFALLEYMATTGAPDRFVLSIGPAASTRREQAPVATSVGPGHAAGAPSTRSAGS